MNLRIKSKMNKNTRYDTRFVFKLQQSLEREDHQCKEGNGCYSLPFKYVSRYVLDQMYKLYVRPHVGYGDIFYHKHNPDLRLDFTKKLESTQYSAALAVSGPWRGTIRQKLYDDLTVGWENLITEGGTETDSLLQTAKHSIVHVL